MPNNFMNNGGMFFGIFPIIFIVMFLIVISVFVIVFVKSISQWNKNNHSPILSVEAKVVTKRTNVSHHSHHTGTDTMHHSSSSTSYYVTFQVESGDRLELQVPSSEFGMLVEGDTGKLTFQGTRFKGFERSF